MKPKTRKAWVGHDAIGYAIYTRKPGRHKTGLGILLSGKTTFAILSQRQFRAWFPGIYLRVGECRPIEITIAVLEAAHA